ncbi:hypothetical protein LXL04_016243 [Taraxacum kok-saghyz]
MLYNSQDLLWRKKLEEQADLQHAIELQNRRILDLQFSDKIVEKYRAHVKKVETHIPENEVHTQTRLFKEQVEKLKAKVREDPVFRREGPNIHVDATLNITQAVLGGTIQVPTLTGVVLKLSECSFGAVKHGVKQGGGQFWNKKDEDLVFYWRFKRRWLQMWYFFGLPSRAATRAANNTKESLESSRTNRGKIVRKNSIKERHQGSTEANKTAGSRASKNSWDNLETSLTNRGKNVRKNKAAENGTKASSRRKLDVGFMHISIVSIGNWIIDQSLRRIISDHLAASSSHCIIPIAASFSPDLPNPIKHQLKNRPKRRIISQRLRLHHHLAASSSRCIIPIAASFSPDLQTKSNIS